MDFLIDQELILCLEKFKVPFFNKRVYLYFIRGKSKKNSIGECTHVYQQYIDMSIKI